MLKGNVQTRFKQFKRSAGHNAVKAASYRSGQELYDERGNVTWDFTRKSGVVHSEIIAPENAPEWTKDRQTLWNAVEAVEKRKDAQLAREFEAALPRELDLETNKKLVQEFVQEKFVSLGMIADLNIHNDRASDGGTNPHVHVMLTMRDITPDGFGNKNRDWNGFNPFRQKNDAAEQLRAAWADHINNYFQQAGLDIRVDHRSYADQGLETNPGIHLGKDVQAMEERGIITKRGDQLREIYMENSIQDFAQFVGQDHVQRDLEELEETSTMIPARDVAIQERGEQNQDRGAEYGR